MTKSVSIKKLFTWSIAVGLTGGNFPRISVSDFPTHTSDIQFFVIENNLLLIIFGSSHIIVFF